MPTGTCSQDQALLPGQKPLVPPLLADPRLLGPKMPMPMFLGRTEGKSPNWEGDGFMPSKELGWSFLMSQVDEFLLEHRKN